MRHKAARSRIPYLVVLAAGLCVGSSAATTGHSVTRFALSPATPNILTHNQQVTVTFSYSTTEPGGVVIYARPMTGDSLPDYAASGADVSATGSGTGTQSFTVRTGHAKVDRIRIQMFNADQSKLLQEWYLPVHYEFQAP